MPVTLIVVGVQYSARRPLGRGALVGAGWVAVWSVMPVLAIAIAIQGESICFG